MLILKRRKEESIMIGDEIEITLLDIKRDEIQGDAARFGITAPRYVPVHRREIYDAIKREKEQKVQGDDQIHLEGESSSNKQIKTSIVAYFNCCGAYGGTTAVQGALKRISSIVAEVYCDKKDSSGYCSIDHTGSLKSCPFGLERLV